jgi:hypothetical protein
MRARCGERRTHIFDKSGQLFWEAPGCQFEDPATPMLHEAIGVAMWAAAILAM